MRKRTLSAVLVNLAALAVYLVPALSFAQGTPSSSLGPTVLTLPTGPGSVAGLADAASLDVFSAQIAYAVPLRVPSQGGLAPALSLDYEGSLGNGPIGVGWALRGPCVRRSLLKGVPTFSDTDELVLEGIAGGGRLVPFGQGEYRVEGQGHRTRVQKMGAGLEVTDENGVRYRLGITANGRQGSEARTAAWFAQAIVNTAGERVELAYVHDRGQVYLDRVWWGPAQVYRLGFFYEDRPDDVISWKTGARVVTARRLSRVRVESFAEELATYRLRYESTGPLSRLASVQVTGRSGLGALPMLSFTYAAPERAHTVALAGTGGWVMGQRGVALHDVNGDGVSDLVRLEMGQHVFRQNLGGAFAAEEPLSGAVAVELQASRFLDLDGDARAELVRVVDDTWRAYRLDGTTWKPVGAVAGTKGLPLGEAGGAVLADLNGDGRTDVLRARAGGLSCHLAARDAMGPAFARPQVSAADPSVEPGAPTVRVLDWNGDDLADVVWLTDAWMKIFLGRGDGTFEVFDRVFYPWGQGALELTSLHLADLNRDGLMDLVRVTAGNVLFYAGTGDHRLETLGRHLLRPESTSAEVLFTTADANGNGSQDLVWSSPRGLWALDLAGPTTAGLLASIDNGLGQTTTFTYSASGLLSVAADLAGTPWAQRLPVSIPVPVRVDQTFADGTLARSVTFRVSEGFWDGEERRFGGFLVGRRVVFGDTLAQTRIEETRYHMGLGEDRVLRGRPWYARVEDGLGTVSSVAETDFRALPVGGLAPNPLFRVAAVIEMRSYGFEGVAVPIETRTTYEYDDQVRPVRVRELGRLDLVGDERLTERRYASDDATWVKDRLIEETLVAADGGVVSSRRFYFGDEQGAEAWGTIGKGWPAATEGWLAQSMPPRWVRLEQAAYDALGNVTRVVASGTTRDIAYDPSGLFALRETVRTGQASTLAWEMAWDQALGKPRTLTDPNGDVTTATYDELGRLVALAQNTLPPHMRFAYDWTAPRPRTTTYFFDGAESTLPALAQAWQAGAPWRQTVTVLGSAGEDRFGATRLGDRWIVSGWKEHDDRGRLVSLSEPFYWDAQALPTTRPAGVLVDTRSYDALDRVVTHTLATGASASFSYAAFAYTKTATDLAPIHTRLDGLGRVIRTERTVAGALDVAEATYDAAGHIAAIRLAEGAVTHRYGYDSLDRLTSAQDPDLGARTLDYNDAGWVTRQQNGAGETIEYEYDQAGRLLRRTAGGGSFFEYHYDRQPDGQAAGHVRGRLGWISEPTGHASIVYDAFGRSISTLRTIDGLVASEALTLSPSGLVLRRSHGDGFAYDVTYDAAARPLRIGAFWEATRLDAAGRIQEERFENGVRGLLEYDAAGLVRRATVSAASTLYDVELARNGFGAVVGATDHDQSGLDHGATFAYDGAARMVDATLGRGIAAYHFTYGYDRLQNLIARTASGPTELGLLAGTYLYGEGGAGPRQLTSVVAPAGTVQPALTSFAYDAAGRQTQDGGSTMTFNALDQLVAVSVGAAGLRIEYGYGFDGLRTKTLHPTGEAEYWFSPDVRVHHGVREHYVKLGERLLARVSLSPQGSSGAAMLVDRGAVARGLLVAATLLLCLALAWPRRRRSWASAMASVCVLVLVAPACQWIGMTQAPLWTATQTIYFHQGFGAGPVLMTRQDGTVLEERRYEPFGQPIDAYRQLGSTSSVGAIDPVAEPHNSLNKPTDPTTGWSYHGARWLAPETGRWLTPDPPVKAPKAGFMANPWDLHPYQYARQNPIAYWDPDGETALFVWHADGERRHIFMVEKGDTLASIARDTGLSEAELLQHNSHLSNAGLKAADGTYLGGYVLTIPKTKRIETLIRAADDIGSTAYAYDVANGITAAGKHKCSAYVNDKKKASGLKTPRRKQENDDGTTGYAGKKSYAPAGQLGDATMTLEHTTVVDQADARPGHTAAFDNDGFSDASGHVIIYTAFLNIWVEGHDYLRASTPASEWGGIGAGEDDVHYYSGPALLNSGRGYENPVFRKTNGEDDLAP
jgi:RHS repeat-associated protein